MNKITKILAPTDLSQLSRAGVRYALNLAKAVGAEVIVYHVISFGDAIHYGDETAARKVYPPQDFLEIYRAALTRFLRDHFSDLLPEVEVREKVEFGRPDKNIVEDAKTEGADLIVMSTHGRTGLSHMLIGSVTEKVVRTAPCPVLSINPMLKEETEQKIAAVA